MSSPLASLRFVKDLYSRHVSKFCFRISGWCCVSFFLLLYDELFEEQTWPIVVGFVVGVILALSLVALIRRVDVISDV